MVKYVGDIFDYPEGVAPRKTSGASDLIEISGEIRHETDKAWLVFDGAREGWVPKSQAEYDASDKTFTMPLWLATEKGFV